MKKCKPNYRMNNFQGCREEKPIFKYGACQQCFIKWTLDTKEGKEWLKKQTAYKYKKNQAEKKKQERKKTKKMKIELMSTSEYWSKVFQPKFNELIRIVDNGCGCIASNRTDGKMNAGHYIHAGKNKTLSINAHNIFLQSFESNHFQSGDLLNYQDGLKNRFGKDYFDFVESLRKCPALHLTKIELMEAMKKVRFLIKEYEHQEIFQPDPKQRIEARNEINETIGLYPKEYSVYKK